MLSDRLHWQIPDAEILDYIDALNPEPELLPRDGSDGWRTLAEMGQALGLLEGIVTWIRALVPPEPQRAAVAIALEAERVNRAADALESAIARRAYAGRLNAAQIVLGTALGWWSRDCPYGNGGKDDLACLAGMTQLRRELRFG